MGMSLGCCSQEDPGVLICLPRTLLPMAQVQPAIRVTTLPERRGGLATEGPPWASSRGHLGAWADPSGVKTLYGCRYLPGQRGRESHLRSEPTPQVCPQIFSL